MEKKTYLILHYIITITTIIISTLAMIYDSLWLTFVFFLFCILIGLREIIRVKNIGDIYQKDLTVIHFLVIIMAILQYIRLFNMVSLSKIAEFLLLIIALVAYTFFFIYFFEPFIQR